MPRPTKHDIKRANKSLSRSTGGARLATDFEDIERSATSLLDQLALINVVTDDGSSSYNLELECERAFRGANLLLTLVMRYEQDLYDYHGKTAPRRKLSKNDPLVPS